MKPTKTPRRTHRRSIKYLFQNNPSHQNHQNELNKKSNVEKELPPQSCSPFSFDTISSSETVEDLFPQVYQTSQQDEYGILFALKRLLKIIHPIIDISSLQQFSQLIIHNMSFYGCEISHWKEMNGLVVLDKTHLQNIVNVLCLYFQSHMVVVKAVAIVRMRKFISQRSDCVEMNELFIMMVKAQKMSMGFAIALIEEIGKNGLGDSLLFLSNLVISQFMLKQFGVVSFGKQKKLIELLVNKLCIIVYCCHIN